MNGDAQARDNFEQELPNKDRAIFPLTNDLQPKAYNHSIRLLRAEFQARDDF